MPQSRELMALLIFLVIIGSLIGSAANDHGQASYALQKSNLRQTPKHDSIPTTLPQANENPFQALANLKIAAVKPIFTATAYSSFYSFYAKYRNTPLNQLVTTDLNLLNASIVHSWSWSHGLNTFLTSEAARKYNITLGSNLSIISEINVIEGALFAANGSRNFDVVILAFTEYVTAEEYVVYRHFVESNGTLIMMDATNFLAEVAYHPGSQRLSLVKGHGWSFNGTAAWRDTFDRWISNNTEWVGSTYSGMVGTRFSGAVAVENNPIGKSLKDKFGARIFTYYSGHEENAVTNLTDTSIIAHWGIFGSSPRNIVAAYLRSYKHSYIIHSGVMASDVVAGDQTVQYFLARSLLFAANKESEAPNISYYSEPSEVKIFTSNGMGSIRINGSSYLHAQSANFSYGLATLTVSPPNPWRLSRWDTSGGVAVINPTSNYTTLAITGSGNLTAAFTRSNVTIAMFTAPKNAGKIVCEGQTYNHGESGWFPAYSLVNCAVLPGANYQFVRWSGLANAPSIQVTFNVTLGGSLTATFSSNLPSAIQPSAPFLLILPLLLLVFLRKLRRAFAAPQ